MPELFYILNNLPDNCQELLLGLYSLLSWKVGVKFIFVSPALLESRHFLDINGPLSVFLLLELPL